MICVRPELIPQIDKYAETELGIPTRVLMQRAGEALCREALAVGNKEKNKVTVLCGCGNNGGDGYAAACELCCAGVQVVVIDVFGCGVRSDTAAYFYSRFLSLGKIIPLSEMSESQLCETLERSDVIIDAVLGTGARCELSPELCSLADEVNSCHAFVLACDVPLGVGAGDGTLLSHFIKADKTVTLSFPKIGLFSYPAAYACGEIVNYGIGIDGSDVVKHFRLAHTLTDDDFVRSLLPPRKKNTHKGSYGTLTALCGSAKYKGAAMLALSSALRTGVGMVRLVSEKEVCDCACTQLPEVIYDPHTLEYVSENCNTVFENASAVLVGCGCGISEELYTIVCNLLKTDGAPLILDADALNSLAEYGCDVLKYSKRSVVITPHPAEMARLCKKTTQQVQSDRMNCAIELSRRLGVVTVLKGASTVITDGERVVIDAKGTSALSKGGSGDVLAGAIASFAAQGASPFASAVCGVYLHSMAGRELSREFSEYGVRPSELSAAMAKYIARLTEQSKERIE